MTDTLTHEYINSMRDRLLCDKTLTGREIEKLCDAALKGVGPSNSAVDALVSSAYEDGFSQGFEACRERIKTDARMGAALQVPFEGGVPETDFEAGARGAYLGMVDFAERLTPDIDREDAMSVDDYSETRPEVLCATTPKEEDERRQEHNQLILDRIHGVPANQERPEDLADPCRPFVTNDNDDVVCKLSRWANDPMWSDHAEVPKTLLSEAADTIKQLREERDTAYQRGFEAAKEMAAKTVSLGYANESKTDFWQGFGEGLEQAIRVIRALTPNTDREDAMSVDDYSETRPEVLCATTPKEEDEIENFVGWLRRREKYDGYGGAFKRAADTIKRLREERDIAQGHTDAAIEDYNDMRAQVEKLREALQTIADGIPRPEASENWRLDGVPSKNDKCPHGLFMYEGCDECISDFARKALSQTEGE